MYVERMATIQGLIATNRLQSAFVLASDTVQYCESMLECNQYKNWWLARKIAILHIARYIGNRLEHMN